jgi:hypothetical protein
VPAPPAASAAKPRWEQKWEQNAAAAERRELPKAIEQNLETTAEMYSDTPKAAALREEIKLLSVEPAARQLHLELVLPSLLCCMWAVAFARGLSPDFPPLPAALVFLLLRLALDASLRGLGLAPKAKRGQITSSSMFNAVIQFLPPPIVQTISQLAIVSFHVKEAVVDIGLFVVAFGVAKALS